MASLQEYVRSSLGKVMQQLNAMKQEHAAMKAEYSTLKTLMPAPSITEEIDRIKGRRIFYNLSGEIDFTTDDNTRRGNPINMLISQDGPFVATHYPMAVWRPIAPATTPNLGLWRPVSAWPLPDQATPASGAFDLDEDIISLSYDFQDSGSQRNFQNEPAGPVFSRPDNMVPLPVPTLFTPNTTITFTPIYDRIAFTSPANTPTAGRLRVTVCGYRIVNL